MRRAENAKKDCEKLRQVQSQLRILSLIPFQILVCVVVFGVDVIRLSIVSVECIGVACIEIHFRSVRTDTLDERLLLLLLRAFVGIVRLSSVISTRAHAHTREN